MEAFIRMPHQKKWKVHTAYGGWWGYAVTARGAELHEWRSYPPEDTRPLSADEIAERKIREEEGKRIFHARAIALRPQILDRVRSLQSAGFRHVTHRASRVFAKKYALDLDSAIVAAAPEVVSSYSGGVVILRGGE